MNVELRVMNACRCIGGVEAGDGEGGEGDGGGNNVPNRGRIDGGDGWEQGQNANTKTIAGDLHTVLSTAASPLLKNQKSGPTFDIRKDIGGRGAHMCWLVRGMRKGGKDVD